MNLFEIVQKLNGPIEAVGETHTDTKRYENLTTMIELAEQINHLLWHESRKVGQHEASVSKSGKKAKKYLENVIEEFSETTGE